MSFDADRLYQLLPAVYRIRDAARGGPLKALLTVIAEQVAVVEEDLAQLYDDAFIETCAGWVVPYIGELVGARGLGIPSGARSTERAEVANTLAYRRRKGTAAVLEQLARDVTGWNASVVEYFARLATTQYMNHPRPENVANVAVRGAWQLESLTTPFDRSARTLDVRRIESRRGRHNIPNVGIFLWRLSSFAATRAPAWKLDDRRYLFDPLGRDGPLYNRVEAERDITHLAEPLNVPMPISRHLPDAELDRHYGTSFLVICDGRDVLPASASPPAARAADIVCLCDLRDVTDALGNVTGWAHTTSDRIGIDPVLGRIVFPTNAPPPATVHVSYHYPFSDALGGGTYGRAGTFGGGTGPLVEVQAGQPIQPALDALATSGGVVQIADDDYHIESCTIRVAAGRKIELRAADEHRPVLVQARDLVIVGGAEAEVSLNGLLISGGRVHVPALDDTGTPNRLRALDLAHCTLPPGPSPRIGPVPDQPETPRLLVETAGTAVAVSRCIVGGVRAVEGARVTIESSIIDAGAEAGVAYAAPDGMGPGAPLEIRNATVIGKVHALILPLVSNTIVLASRADGDGWEAPMVAARLQEGCVRFSHLPVGARVPRRHECQPTAPADAARVRPVFTSLRHGDGGYCQLAADCPVEIGRGADDAAAMGVFHDLYQPQREASLRALIAEYLRFGLEAGIFFAS